MAESSGQEKTEEATPKRLRDARKKGQIARSRDLNTIVILIAAFGVIFFMLDFIIDQMRIILVTNFNMVAQKDLTIEATAIQGVDALMSFVKMFAPFCLAISVVAIAISFLQSGPIFSPEPMKPQMKRINAIENLKNMFKMTTFIELLKNIAKMSLIFLLAYLVIGSNIREIVMTVKATPDQSVTVAATLLVEFLAKVFVVFIVIAVIDFFVQRWQYKKQLRMTKEEVKREYKQDEGDPLIKSMRRQMHQEMAMSDTKQSVRSADAVITNPTELAVAIKYDEKEMAAPQILAKGQRLFADAIREFATEFNVPIIQNPPLAWALIELDVGDEVPEELYAAVAEILVYVYKLKKQRDPGQEIVEQ